jgi:MATE family multidrug resistance protein
VLAIAFPVMLANATVPILGAVDTGVVGQLGEAAPIGAVGVGAVILSSIYWLFGFLRMGTVGLVAQADGAGDKAEVSALLTRALLLGLVAGAFLIAVQNLVVWGGFALAPASEEVEALASQYIAVRIWSAPAAIALYGITGWLVARERTRVVFAIQLVMNGLNVALDLIFVLGFGWGVAGVAFATVIAEFAGFGLGLWLCRDAFADPRWRDWARIFDRTKLLKFASLSRDITIRSFLLLAMFTSFLFIAADLGDIELAANQILMQFVHITAYALDGFAFTAETLIGQALGARNRASVRRAAKMSGLWGGVLILAMTIFFALAGTSLIDIMTAAPEVRAAARVYLIFMVLSPLLGGPSWMLDGIFIGATRGRDMRNMMIISFAVYVISVIALVPAYGNHGLWISLLIAYIARGVTLGLRYPALEAQADRGEL